MYFSVLVAWKSSGDGSVRMSKPGRNFRSLKGHLSEEFETQLLRMFGDVTFYNWESPKIGVVGNERMHSSGGSSNRCQLVVS